MDHLLQQSCRIPSVQATSTDKPTRLTDLDDACLLLIFKHLMPLPDLFCCAQTCWRFHRLTSDKRMWLIVSPSYIHPEDTPAGRAGIIYSNLKAAVAASRPGDTIWLAPGVPHEAADISVTHPLHILGGGLNPEQTFLTAPPGADCALSFSASCKIAMLAVYTTLCPCLVHNRGLLTVERCKLTADPRGLLHLVSPVVTIAATSSSSSSSDSIREISSAGFAAPAHHPCPSMQSACNSNSSGDSRNSKLIDARPSVGAGRLVVVECCLQGGSTGVRCCGTGRLRDVRVIYESRAAFFWLEVDSSDPGNNSSSSSGWRQQEQQQQIDVFLQYSQLQQHHDLMLNVTGAVGIQQQRQQQCQLDVVRLSKAKDWHHNRALGSVPEVAADDTVQPQQQQQRSTGSAPLSGLARIQAVLGKRVNPSMLAAHLEARKHLVQQQRE